MTSAPRVRAIVLNYNGGNHVLDAVAALEKTDWPRDRLELVVIDNASVDGSDREVEQRFPAVRLMRSASNLGFPGNNLAMTGHDADYVALVNNDAFVTPGWLAPLVDALEADPKLGAACPKILFAPSFADVVITAPTFRPPGDGRDLGVRVSGLEIDGRDRFDDAQFADGFWGVEAGPPDEASFAWSSGRATIRVPLPPDDPGPFRVRVRLAAESAKTIELAGTHGPETIDVSRTPQWVETTVAGPGYDVVNNVGSVLVTLGFGGDRGYLERDNGQYDRPEEVFAWCGGGVLLRREYLEAVGLFDETFFLYYEDTDLAWRGRAQGWRYRYVPDAVIRHVHAASTGESSPVFQHYVERNRLLMLLKNAPWSLVLNAIYRYVRMVTSFTVRRVVIPLARGRRPQPQLPLRRIRSFAGFLRCAPGGLRARRKLRRKQVVPDAELLGWMVDR
jgi:GT2 family glycosyltransferase